jgi:hypothetical protein
VIKLNTYTKWFQRVWSDGPYTLVGQNPIRLMVVYAIRSCLVKAGSPCRL